MSATVHRLFPTPGGPLPPDTELLPAAHPIIDSLRALTQPLLVAQLRALFEGADDSLFAMSQRSGVGDEQRFAFDTMRRLRLERRRIEREFERALWASFESSAALETGEIDLDRQALQHTEELEEKIAVGNLAAKAETRHREALRELNRRINHLIRQLGVPIARHALSPESICEAFKASLRGLDLTLSVRLLLYKLFDQYCAAGLGQIYQAAARLFDAHGVRPLEPLPAAATPTWSAYGAPPDVAAFIGDQPLELPTLDRHTREALQDIGDRMGGYRPQDAAFAEELLGFATRMGLDAPSASQVAPSQRLSLVGQMCNEILSDPHLPKSMRPPFERLRFPLIKIALADGSFFSNRAHPVRRLVAEAAETAASSRVASPTVVRRLEERLRHIAEQIDLSATFVRPEVHKLLPLNSIEISAFLDQQREESETRRENVLNKVRRTVAQELEVHTLGRKPLPSLLQFLRIGWGPLMAARLLRDGMNSRPWIDAINRLVQVLISMDATEISAEHHSVRARLIDAVARDLIDIGMRNDKVDTAATTLRQAYRELDARLAAMTPEDRQRQELSLLSPEETAAVMAEFPAPGSEELRVPAAETLGSPLPSELRLDPLPEPPRLPDVVPESTDPMPANASTGPSSNDPLLPRPVPPDAVESWDLRDTPSPTAAPDPPAAQDPEPPPAPEPPSAGRAEPVAPRPPTSNTDADADAAQVSEPGIDAHTPDAELLALCLPAESWFRVYDAQRKQTLWLKVSRYYAEHGSVGFTGFDAKQTLSIRDARFISDLVQGRTEPVNASPVQIRAIAELRQRHR